MIFTGIEVGTFEDYKKVNELEFILPQITTEEVEQEYTEFWEYVEKFDFLGEAFLLDEGIISRITGHIKKKLTFIKDLAMQTGFKAIELLKMFKDSRVFKFFSLIGWSFEKLFQLLKRGFRLGHDLADAISEYLAKTKVGKWTEEELKKLDIFLKSHPKTRKVGGVAVAALLVYIWFNMTFTGDAGYDFDMSSMLGALQGNYALASIFAGKDGFKLLGLFITGLAGLTFPWPGSGSVKFISAIIQTIVRKIKSKVSLVKSNEPLVGVI